MASSSKQASPPKQYPSLSIRNPKVRPRANTQEHLGQRYIPFPNSIPEAPEAQTLEDYNEDRVKQGLQYADCVLRHPECKLSPVGTAGIKIYKDTCKKFLDFLLDDEMLKEDRKKDNRLQFEYVYAIRRFESDITYTACMKIIQTPVVARMQKELFRLKRMSYYARYGDFYGKACKELQNIAKEKVVDGWKSLDGGYWTDINKSLQEEKRHWEELLAGKSVGADRVPIHLAVERVSAFTTFDQETNLKLIQQYAERNTIFHASLFDYIKAGQITALAKKLGDDLCDVPATFTEDEKFEQTLLQDLINSVIDKWYTRRETDPDNFEYWIPRPEFVQFWEDLQQNDKEKQVKKEQEVKNQLMRAWEERMRKKQQDVEKEQDVTRLGQLHIPAYGKVKRVASADWDEELKRHQKMAKRWEDITDRAYGVRKSSEKYVEEYGFFGPPPNLARDN